MSVTVTMFATANGSPYIPNDPPTIDIWRVNDGAKIITGANMTQIGTSSFYKYDFSSSVTGVSYVYTITGESFLISAERYKMGSIYQDAPDRLVGTVQTNGINSANQFQSSQTETTTDHWKDALVLFVSGSLTGQIKKCTGYNGSTKVMAFLSGFTGTPADGDTYEILID